jgi:tetratricopeptide (TPR) repeat protein
MNASRLGRFVLFTAISVSTLSFVSCQQHGATKTVSPRPTPAPAPLSLDVPTLRLGSVDFPTSGSAAAQPHFIYGVAALHSFWYEEALEAFGRAAAIDPSFAMAYWGEAMCYHRSYRPGSDYPAGRKAIAKIKRLDHVTKRERAYIEAARTLFGSTGSAKTKEHASEMEELYRKHPADQEAAAFYALALLGARGKENLEKAGKIAEALYRQNPNHPGAAHYIIHAYDNAESASRALEAAHHYAKIAPDAPHALHMPSHIFVQLGMWREATTSNDQGWAASVDYVKRKQLTPTLRDYHNLHWLIYASLQEGRYARATALVDEFVRMRTNNELASYSSRYIHSALAAYLVETRRWDQTSILFADPDRKEPVQNARPIARTTGPREIELCGAEPAAPTKAPKSASAAPASTDTPTFFRAYAAAVTRGISPVDPGGKAVAGAARFPKIRELQLTGLARAQSGDFAAAIPPLREAAALEAKTGRPPGPPVEKPAHELLGEVLLSAGQPKDALAQFTHALERHPNRALSLLGRARAEATLGDRSAARVTYARLLEFWREADPDLPELREARNFVAAKLAAAE